MITSSKHLYQRQVMGQHTWHTTLSRSLARVIFQLCPDDNLIRFKITDSPFFAFHSLAPEVNMVSKIKIWVRLVCLYGRMFMSTLKIHIGGIISFDMYCFLFQRNYNAKLILYELEKFFQYLQQLRNNSWFIAVFFCIYHYNSIIDLIKYFYKGKNYSPIYKNIQTMTANSWNDKN